MGYLGHLRIILTPSGMVRSGHPQIVLNYGRNAGVRNARGHTGLVEFSVAATNAPDVRAHRRYAGLEPER